MQEGDSQFYQVKDDECWNYSRWEHATDQGSVSMSMEVIVEAQRGKKWSAAKHADQSVRTMY